MDHTATTLLDTNDTPLVRVDFSDPAAWQEVVTKVRTPSDDGFRAYVQIIDDGRLAGCDPIELAKCVRDYNKHAICVFADARTMSHPDRSLRCVYFKTLLSLRTIPSELWSVENNLSLANMDFDDFIDASDDDGVFRGF